MGGKLHSQLGGSREALGNMDMSNKSILICLLSDVQCNSLILSPLKSLVKSTELRNSRI